MISFETAAGRFNYRVAGVALTANRVLLHHRDGDDFCTLPGGRPQAMEPAGDALRREPLRPAFLATALRTLPATPVHVVHED